MPYHTCDAVIVGCIDFRFKDSMRKLTDDLLGSKQYDIIRYAGATKELYIVLNQIDISVRLHRIKQAVLVHHEDCGAYGIESTYERHSEDLKKAKRVIQALHPHLEVNTIYLKLDGTWKELVEGNGLSHAY